MIHIKSIKLKKLKLLENFRNASIKKSNNIKLIKLNEQIKEEKIFYLNYVKPIN